MRRPVVPSGAEVREMKMDMELEYSDVQERYRTLRVYDIPVDEAEYQRAMALDSLWRDTVNGALTKDMRLIKVRRYTRSGNVTHTRRVVLACSLARRRRGGMDCCGLRCHHFWSLVLVLVWCR